MFPQYVPTSMFTKIHKSIPLGVSQLGAHLPGQRKIRPLRSHGVHSWEHRPAGERTQAEPGCCAAGMPTPLPQALPRAGTSQKTGESLALSQAHWKCRVVPAVTGGQAQATWSPASENWASWFHKGKRGQPRPSGLCDGTGAKGLSVGPEAGWGE